LKMLISRHRMVKIPKIVAFIIAFIGGAGMPLMQRTGLGLGKPLMV